MLSLVSKLVQLILRVHRGQGGCLGAKRGSRGMPWGLMGPTGMFRGSYGPAPSGLFSG